MANPEKLAGNARGGHYFAVAVDSTRVSVTLNARSRFLRQYFLYVRRGAQRVAVTSDAPGVRPLAFRHPDGRRAVVAKTERPATLALLGLPAGRCGFRWTTDRSEGMGTPVDLAVGDTLRASIPGRGVLTVFTSPPADSTPVR